MSLILDALRRADAERQREAGAPPSLGAPVAPAWDEDATPQGRGAALWLGGALLLLAASGLAWWLNRAPSAPAPAVATAPPAPPVARVPEPPPEPPAVTAPPEAPLPPMSLRLPDVPPVPVAAPRVPKPAPRAASAVSPPAASAPARGPEPAASSPVSRLADLPPDQRRQWPALVVGGSMYSENVALRMVILDGQLLHEGDSAGPGVVVERIRPRSAVLRAGAQRVEVGW
ncbi:hypothetical protein BurJ1DRAFT_1753 [Burkholderiales bacterium JOSHI_001]|nr:hypothetical protein BurJ1DRAFT_1753 [Burkholderiales bacterium JOSHI_001]